MQSMLTRPNNWSPEWSTDLSKKMTFLWSKHAWLMLKTSIKKLMRLSLISPKEISKISLLEFKFSLKLSMSSQLILATVKKLSQTSRELKTGSPNFLTQWLLLRPKLQTWLKTTFRFLKTSLTQRLTSPTQTSTEPETKWEMF